MNSVLTFVRKLAPFESIWLILLKVLILNRIPGSCVINLIKKKESEGGVADYLFRWWNLENVSLEHLEAALQLRAGDLDNCFINKLVKSSVKVAGYSVRHCPECLAKKYHSSLFDLPIIKTCPWHNCELFSCEKCNDVLRCFCGGTKSKQNFRLNADNVCDHLLHFLDGLPVSAFDTYELERVDRWLASFRQWVHAGETLVGIDIHEALSSSRGDVRDFVLSYLEFKIGNPGSILHNLMHPVKRIIVPHHKQAWLEPSTKAFKYRAHAKKYFLEQCNGQVLVSSGDMVASLKALRRHIKKTFVRPHKKCVCAVSRLTQIQAMNLNPYVTCSCAIAYSAWLIQLLDVESLIQVFSISAKNYRLPEEPMHYPVSLFHITLVKLFASFIGAWAAVEVVPSSLQFSKIIIKQTTMRSFSLASRGYSCTALPYLQRRECWLLDYGCYVVDPEYLQSQNMLKCNGKGMFIGRRCDLGWRLDSDTEYFISNASHIFCFKIPDIESVKTYEIVL